MIEGLPYWIELLFLFTAVLTILLFYISFNRPIKLLVVIISIGIIHSILASNLFYRVTDAMPPRFVLVLLPATIIITYGLLSKRRGWIISNKKILISTLLHTIRIPVEICLYFLFIHETIPENLTFSGRNFDIVIGSTAPVIAFLYSRKVIGLKALLAWNVIGLGFIFFILGDGILSSELPFQQFAFDQPNKGMTFFPFILLPAVVVPIVIYTHLSDIIKIRSELKTKNTTFKQ